MISYQVPTYRLNGALVHFAAQPRHLSFTVVSLDVVNEFRGELGAFDISGRTIRFSPEQTIPATLVTRIVQARVRENEARVESGQAVNREVHDSLPDTRMRARCAATAGLTREPQPCVQ